MGECERLWLCAGWQVIHAYIDMPGYLVIDEPDIPLTVVMVLPSWVRAEMRDYMFAWVMARMAFEQIGLIGVLHRLRELEALLAAPHRRDAAA